VIGQVTERGEPVIARDTDADPVHRRNELLPFTRSEMALPLHAGGGRVIGALDIQSVNPNAFSETDISIFQTVADQLAIAIENAHLFTRAQRDLQEIETLNRQLTGEAWRRFTAGRHAAGYQTDQAGLKPLAPGDSGDEDKRKVSLPLQVRGETIGMLDIVPPEGEEPDEEVRLLLEAVAERVANALDTSRLSEQTQYQAAREQILSRLSAELQAVTDLDVILRVAAREASDALGTGQSFVHLIARFGSEQ
jgi:GAF domain-containing protein